MQCFGHNIFKLPNNPNVTRSCQMISNELIEDLSKATKIKKECIAVREIGLTGSNLQSKLRPLTFEALTKNNRYDQVFDSIKNLQLQPGNPLCTDSAFSLIECSRKFTLWLYYEPLEIVIKVRFVNSESDHHRYLAKLFHSYLSGTGTNGCDVQKFVFGTLHLFEQAGMTGQKYGFPSKRALLLMLISWLMSQKILKNAQDKQDIEPPKLEKERKSADFPDFSTNKFKDLRYVDSPDAFLMLE